MDLNLTLFGEMLTFAVLLWFMTKYIWPRLTKAIEERQQQIETGLLAAQKSQKELESVQQEVTIKLKEASLQANKMLGQAEQQAEGLVVQAKVSAQQERDKMLTATKAEIASHFQQVNSQLQQQVAGLLMSAVEKVIKQEVSNEDQQRLLDEIIAKI